MTNKTKAQKAKETALVVIVLVLIMFADSIFDQIVNLIK